MLLSSVFSISVRFQRRFFLGVGVIAVGVVLVFLSSVLDVVPRWLGLATALAPVLYCVLAVLLPFVSAAFEFDYLVGLDYWTDLYALQHHVGPADGKAGPRGKTPPVFPNGWFKVCNSHDVPKRGVLNVRLFGKDMVLFRRPDGKLGLLDAYCPHLGAHIGVGGVVTEDGCIQCPFHGWKFGTDGKCQEIPYLTGGSIPAQAQTKSYELRETHRVVLVWFDAENRAPHWELEDAWPQIPREYVRVGQATHHIPCHISEVPENGADVAHLNFLHTDVHPAMRWVKNLIPAKFVWGATWAPSPQTPEFTDMTLTERLVLKGREIGLVSSDAIIRQVGPGLVILSLTTAFGRVILLQSIVPIEPYHQKLETVMFVSPNPLNLTFVCRLMLLAYAENVERDVLIWGRKRYLFNPVLVRDDGPIGKFRKWYNQFYSENSPTWASIQEEKQRLFEISNW